eukprot:TRINITY_DN1696_c0_g1_i3.p1 TRINITY_DN1696_c0_g1~~TRINITY_DN1696_c0_g1_i3.p1  ORF type:complete len:229 (-),score=48.85 TRINITY_DN1696_c0_g1_i3:544-1230(-)
MLSISLREKKSSKEDTLNDAEVVLDYVAPPVEGKKETRMSLTRHDLKTLDEGSYINDNIILFFLKFIQHQLLSEDMRKKVYVFDTHFIAKFRGLCANEYTREKCMKAYQEMRRWTRTVDILSKDFLVFPIHEAEHWSLIVVCYPSRLFKQQQPASGDAMEAEAPAQPQPTPSIIGFDSLEILQKSYADMIKIYLEMECQNKRPEAYEEMKETGKIDNIPFCQMIVICC